jgi:hypothetical protein
MLLKRRGELRPAANRKILANGPVWPEFADHLRRQKNPPEEAPADHFVLPDESRR